MKLKDAYSLEGKVMTKLDSILKSRDITLPTKVHLVKAVIFPVVMYGCESWTIKKAESQRIDAFELWCWRRLLRVPWTARRSNQSILKDISRGCSLEGLMLKLHPSRARTLEAGKRWARLAQARAASRPGLCAIAPGRRAGAPPLWHTGLPSKRCPGIVFL